MQKVNLYDIFIFELFGSIRLTNILDHVTVSNYLYVGFSYISVLFFWGMGIYLILSSKKNHINQGG